MLFIGGKWSRSWNANKDCVCVCVCINYLHIKNSIQPYWVVGPFVHKAMLNLYLLDTLPILGIGDISPIDLCTCGLRLSQHTHQCVCKGTARPQPRSQRAAFCRGVGRGAFLGASDFTFHSTPLLLLTVFGIRLHLPSRFKSYVVNMHKDQRSCPVIC